MVCDAFGEYFRDFQVHPTERFFDGATCRVDDRDGPLVDGRDKVKTVEVHHFSPSPNKILDKLPVRVRTSVDL